jgi:hypothetical protein
MNQNPALGDQALAEEEVQQRAMALIRAVGPPLVWSGRRSSPESATSSAHAFFSTASSGAAFGGRELGPQPQCLSTAADIPAPIPGTAAERKFNQALDCGLTTPGKGGLLLAQAEGKGFEIKAAAG